VPRNTHSAGVEHRGGDPKRNALLAAYHVRAKRLGWDEETRRAWLKRETGFESAAQLSNEQLAAVLDKMKAVVMPRPRHPERPVEPQIAMLRNLWTECYLNGLIKSAGEPALIKFVRRTTGVDAIGWLTAVDANKAIEGLKAMLKRARTERVADRAR
jgi:Bacteriophage Mu, GemA protein